MGSAETGTVTSGTPTSTLAVNAGRLTSLTVKNGGDLDLSASTFTSLASLTAQESGKALKLPALPAATTIKVGGYLNTSAVTLSTIGTTDSTSTTPLSLTATGLMVATGKGLTVGDINSAKANITVDLSALMGEALIGKIVGKEVEIKASGANKLVTIDSITGSKVTVDATDASTGFAVTNGITADTSVNYKSVNLVTNLPVTITGSANSTALNVSITGGFLNDTFTVTAGAKQTAVTVSGDLIFGINTLSVNLATATTAGVTANVSGIYGYSLVTIIDSSGNDTITGSPNADAITCSSGGNDSINGGKGNDSIDGGDGQDTATFSAALDAYKIRYDANGLSVEYVGSDKSNQSIDTLKNIEMLEFSGHSYAVVDLMLIGIVIV